MVSFVEVHRLYLLLRLSSCGSWVPEHAGFSGCIWYEVRSRLGKVSYSACESTIILRQFVEKSILSSLSCHGTFVEDHLIINVRVYFCSTAGRLFTVSHQGSLDSVLFPSSFCQLLRQ